MAYYSGERRLRKVAILEQDSAHNTSQTLYAPEYQDREREPLVLYYAPDAYMATSPFAPRSY